MPDPLDTALAEVLAVAKPDETIVVRVPADHMSPGLMDALAARPGGGAGVLIVAEDCDAEAVPGSVADELHRLHGVNDRLRAALTEIRDSPFAWRKDVRTFRNIAREALAGGPT